MNKLEYLVYGGGGVKGMFFISALAALQNEGFDYHKIKGCAGTSIGTMFGLMTILEMSLENMVSLSLEMSYDYLLHPSATIFEGFGMVDMIGMKQFIIDKIFVPYGLSETCTFLELKQKCHGKKFVVTVSDLTDHKKLLFGDDESTDHESVLERMLDSMCLPGLFSRRFYKGHWVADGAWYNNLPVTVFPPDQTLVLSFPHLKGASEQQIKAMNSGQFLYEMLLSCHLFVCKEQTRDGKIPHLIIVPDMGITSVHIHLSKEKRIQLMQECYDMICEQRNQLGHLAARCLEIFLK